MIDDARIEAFTSILGDLADLGGQSETTRIVPNLTVINASPSTLPSGYIIIQDDQGFHVPALKVPGVTYANNDKVNVLFIKGTEPIAYQHGTGSPGGLASSITVRKNSGADVGTRPRLNFIEGSSITLTIADDSPSNEIDITIASSGGGGWPFDNVRTVSQTNANADHSTIAAAIAAASAGDIILLDAETFTVTATITVDKAVTIIGHLGGTVVTTSTDSLAVFTITAVGAQLRNMTISNSGAGTGSRCVSWEVNNVVLENCIITKTGNPTLNRALHHWGGTGAKIINCDVSCSGGTNNFAYYNDIAAASAEIRVGKLDGAQNDIRGDITGSTLKLFGTILVNNTISYSGTLTGSPADSNLNIIGKGAGVTHSVAQTISHATETTLSFDTERWDDAGFHDTVTNNSRLTVPTGMGGKYAISAHARFALNATGYRYAYIRLNGSTVIAATRFPVASGGENDLSWGTEYNLVAGDYVEFRVYQTSGGNLDVQKGNNFSPEFRMQRVG